jgi:ribosomal protein L35
VPKLKTRKGLSKRIRVTRNAKLMRKHAWKSHWTPSRPTPRACQARRPSAAVLRTSAPTDRITAKLLL